ncbi:MAG: valine--tRNA ligase, partial [Leptospiraceae bacterium]|nr:valine--tRNA ligase [Leptospiraceae bacterium]
AGIATQVRVERMLAEQGLDRYKMGREKFIAAVWERREKYGSTITNQQRVMGFSLDWSRERFTMDDGLSRAVHKVFVDLYKEGLIYRDTRLVNWDPVTRTVLSDLEVEYDDSYEGELFSFAYELTSGSGEIIVATTRPETMLGDTAIAVHPDDDRYKHLIGKTVKHPFIDREIPIIGDAVLVDPKFGSGAVKVTPAHDPNDYETGKRHDLEFISILDEAGHINEHGGKFHGMERFEARKAVKKALEDRGLVRETKKHKMSVGRSQRSGTIVEPMISTQWFVKTKPLAETAIASVEKGDIRFVPSQWEKTYFHWMNEIRDWCISRQLWWGHRIPAWYGPDGEIFVAHDEEEAHKAARKHYGRAVELNQDEDVLDTWFSSGLWPFSTMGWPDKTADLKAFYPTTVLVTAFDIIFFWVARMIMLGLHFMKAPPFRDVYIHGLLRDEKGDKISKTKGNGIDPLVAVEQYGADAFRFFLMATLSEGKDSVYSEQRLKGYQNFANKIWNSSRFVFMNLPEGFTPVESPEALYKLKLEEEDWWVLAELNRVQAEVARTVKEYKIHLAADEVYSFTWRIFCDWYIEFIKPRMFGKTGEESADSARQTAYYTLKSMLGILSPFMPYIAEELYSHILKYRPADNPLDEMIITAPWPTLKKLPKKAERPAMALALLQDVIGAARLIRGEMNIPPDTKVPLIVRTDNADLKKVIASKEMAIQRLGRISEIKVVKTYKSNKFDALETFTDGEVYLPLEGILDVQKESNRLKGEVQKLDKTVEGIQKKLSNAKFLENAPAEVVEKEKGKLAEMEQKRDALQRSLKRLNK